jgi:hypothetical protein
MRSATSLEEDFMIRTAYPEIYDELCDVKKLFKLKVHLFTTALAIGVLYELRSEKKPKHDIIRLSQLKDREGEWNMDEQRELIDLLARVCCKGSDKRSLGLQLLSYADGGLEKLNREYQEQGTLDLSRILEEGKKTWPRRIEELLREKVSNKANG